MNALKKKYNKALEAGKEIVIIPAGRLDNSAIFWTCDGDLWVFSKEIGMGKSEHVTKETAADHFIEQIVEYNAQVYIRG